jgi:ABC-type transport system involved in multi-copper enzyme maturation permease subunit
MFNLLNSEIFRTVKRPVTWIMLAILVLIVAAFYTIIYFAISDPETAEELRPDQIRNNGFGLGSAIASILVIVLAAQSMGSEYGWGTIRALVSRASGRIPLIAAKLIVLIGYTLVTMVVAAVASVGFALLFSSLAGNDTSLSGHDWTNIVEAVLRAVLGAGVYAVVALVITILSKSTAAGIAGAIALNFLEPAIWALLGAASDRFDTVSHYFLNYNVTGVTSIGTSMSIDDYDVTRGTIILVAWLVGLLAIALYVFKRRDVTSG